MTLDTLRKPHGGRFDERALYRPRHVALIADPALPIAALLARNLASGGFQGTLAVVGMAAEGLVEAAGIAELPNAPDLAVLALRPEALEPAMTALAARGCFAAVVPGEGPREAPDLAALCRRTGVRALGAGSFGICVPAIGLNASLSHLPPRPGKLALVSQSAAIARTVIDWAEAESLGFSHVIGIGANTDLGFAHALDWLSRDPGTGTILLDLRRIKNRRMFISAARAAARTRPVLALRPGGRLAEPSGLADAVMEAALRRAGVLRVRGLEDLFSAAETLARTKLSARAGAKGGAVERIAILANGLSLAQLAADAVLEGGGRIATIADPALASLAIALPGGIQGRNPFILPPVAGTALGEAAAMLASLPEVDAVIALHAPVMEENAESIAASLTAAARASRSAPILLCWAGQATAGQQRAGLAAAGLAVFPTPEAAAHGALHLLTDRRNRAAAAELPGREVLALKPDRAFVARLFATIRQSGRLSLTEDEALSVLGAYGLPIVPGRVAAGVEEAADAATLLGFPVVLKLRSATISRKTDVGGVMLGLRNAQAVREAAAEMLARVRRLQPDAALEGFLVQRQAARALELRLWLGEEAMFGPYIGFGLGGTAAELLGDAGYDLPPLNMTLANALIARSRAARLMAGYRDQEAVAEPAVAEALVRLSQIAVDFPEVASLSVNPLFVDAEGVLAADAGLDLRPAGERGLLAIPPYPEEWVTRWATKSGEMLTLRPIRPEDAAAHSAFIRRLSPEDIRYRFFSQIKELPPVQIARLTQIDYDREMAFVAMRPSPEGAEEMMGVSRLIREPDGETGEFAVIVDSQMKGQGLGAQLMQRLFDWAPSGGITMIAGQVLADNAPMLAFVKRLGFTTRRSPEDEDVMEARRVV